MNYTCKHCSKEFEFRGHSYSNIYCSSTCFTEERDKKKSDLWETRYNKWLNGEDIGRSNPRKLIREFLIKRDGYKCKKCGIDSWNGEHITLWTDHIDGDATNNHPSNFRLVCPNCDSQSDTFGGKNYGNGRKSKGLPQYG